MRSIVAVVCTLLSVVSISSAQLTKWLLDRDHSSFGFAVSHLVISEVTGGFDDFAVDVVSDVDDFTDAKITVVVKTASINTQNQKRDGHLRSDDFFNAEKFPEMRFVGKKMEKVSGNRYKLSGDLTIRDITKPVTLDVKLGGVVKDPWGNTKAGFKVSGEVDRFEYGLKWNVTTETGGLVAGDVITIVCNLELTKQK